MPRFMPAAPSRSTAPGVEPHPEPARVPPLPAASKVEAVTAVLGRPIPPDMAAPTTYRITCHRGQRWRQWQWQQHCSAWRSGRRSTPAHRHWHTGRQWQSFGQRQKWRRQQRRRVGRQPSDYRRHPCRIGTISANGGSGNGLGGGGGGGRIPLGYTTSVFTGPVSTCGGGGYANGGAGTIYTRANSQSVGQLLVDNGGLSGTNTPLSSAYGTPASPFNLTVGDGAVVCPQPSFPVLSNLTITAGSLLTSFSGQSNLDLVVLGNVDIATGGAIAVDANGFAEASGPGAGQSAGGIPEAARAMAVWAGLPQLPHPAAPTTARPNNPWTRAAAADLARDRFTAVRKAAAQSV